MQKLRHTPELHCGKIPWGFSHKGKQSAARIICPLAGTNSTLAACKVFSPRYAPRSKTVLTLFANSRRLISWGMQKLRHTPEFLQQEKRRGKNEKEEFESFVLIIPGRC